MLSSIVEYWKILFVNYDNVQKKVHTYVLQKHVDLKKPCIEWKQIKTLSSPTAKLWNIPPR